MYDIITEILSKGSLALLSLDFETCSALRMGNVEFSGVRSECMWVVYSYVSLSIDAIWLIDKISVEPPKTEP